MNRTAATRILLLALAGAGLVALFTWWWLRTYERVADTIDLPPRGEAAYNPLYPLKLALGKNGRRVDARQRLDLSDHPLKAADTVLMLGDPRTLSAADVDGLLAWVETGGHLILRTPPPGSTISGEDVPLLSDLGIVVMDADPVCEGLQVAKLEHHIEFCDGRRFYFFDEDAEVAATWGNEETAEYAYARVIFGDGTVDVIADLDFLHADKLEEAQHAALVRQLLQPNWADGGTFHLIYSASMPSLWDLLWQYGWRAIVPSLLALLLWLWMRTERFGPLRPAAPPDRRSLLEHVQASGDHLYRYGRRGTLYAAAYDAFLRRLRQRDPYAAALEGPAQIDAIARRTGLSTADVDAALRYPRPGDTKDFVLRIAKLLQLRARL
jgi:hypothetical protein